AAGKTWLKQVAALKAARRQLRSETLCMRHLTMRALAVDGPGALAGEAQDRELPTRVRPSTGPGQATVSRRRGGVSRPARRVRPFLSRSVPVVLEAAHHLLAEQLDVGDVGRPVHVEVDGVGALAGEVLDHPDDVARVPGDAGREQPRAGRAERLL